MLGTEVNPRRSEPHRYYNEEKVETVKKLENSPEDFDDASALVSKINYTIYNENSDLFWPVSKLYVDVTGAKLSANDIVSFAAFLLRERITPPILVRLQRSKQSEEVNIRYYFLTSQYDFAKKRLQKYCALQRSLRSNPDGHLEQ